MMIQGLSTLAKEFTAATRKLLRMNRALWYPVRQKCKQTKATA